MEHHVFSLIITLIICFGLTLLFQYMGSRGILFASPPPNCFGILVMRGGSKEEKNEGGEVVDVVHAIPGHIVSRRSGGTMKWCFVAGEEVRNWLFRTLGIIWLGPYKTLRVNTLRSFRFGREDEESEYHIMPKTSKRRWVPFSGQQDIDMKDVETKSTLAVNMKINVPLAYEYPVRSMLKVADANAVMTLIVQERVIDKVGDMELRAIISGVETAKREIVRAVALATGIVSVETGLAIGTPNIFDLSMNEETKRLMELETKTAKEMAAEVQKAQQRIEIADRDAQAAVKAAEGRKKARILDNDADADHIERNVKPRAKDEFTVRVTEAEAYRDNEHVTTSIRVNL